MNKEKMGRDKIENGKKNKNNSDTLRPIVKETQTNVYVIYCYFNYAILYNYIILAYYIICSSKITHFLLYIDRTCRKRNNAYRACC